MNGAWRFLFQPAVVCGHGKFDRRMSELFLHIDGAYATANKIDA
jgi:hypothetical protein